MNKIVFTAAVFSLLSSAAFAADKYEIDPQHAWIGFKVNHAGWSNAHGLFQKVSGEIEFDKTDVTKSSLSLDIDATSIATNFAQRDSDLKSPDFLNVDEFPTITFKSTSVEKTGERSGKVTGDLTLAGVTKPVALDVTWNAEAPLPWDKNTVKTGFSAVGSFNAVDLFGLKKLADYGLGPDIKLDIDVEAIKK